ncbi:MAG TPA: ShlB/FhaC/HecB family hemolysin secretion/activation protein [Caulobacteraceae bacterium]
MLAAAAVWPGPGAQAQQPAPRPGVAPQQLAPTPQQLNPSQQLPPQAQARASDIFLAPEPGPCPLRDSQLTFELKGVSFTGAVGGDAKNLDRAFKDQVGQTLPVASICQIRDRAAAILFSKGVLARVEIPAQRIEGGQVQLEVIEAHIASVTFHGDAGAAQAKVEAYLERLRGLTPFNLNTAQRYLLLAADVPGVQIQAAIRPSAGGRGAVDLDVTVSRNIVSVAANVQNYGSQALGPWAALARADLKGLTPYGDQTGVVLYSTLDFNEQRIFQIIEDMRPTDTGLIVHGSLSYAWSQPRGALAPLKLKGTALDAEFSANYPIIRRRRSNLNVIAGVAIVDQNTDFASGGALIDDKLRVAYLRLDGQVRTTLFGRLPIEGELGLEARKGLSVLGASRANDIALSRASGIPDASIGRADGHLSLGFSRWVEGYIAYQAQYSTVPLLSFEQMAVGNLTIGRGYDPSSVEADRGVAASFEARFMPVKLPAGFSVSAYGFYDLAYVAYVDNPESSTVHSAGAGLRISAPRGVDLDVFYAKPFDKPTPSAPSIPTPRVMVSLTYRR